MRPHISLNVRDVAKSAAFYEKIFSVPPQKLTPEYAKFDLQDPPLNFSLLATGQISRINHLGIEVTEPEAIEAWNERLSALGLAERTEENVACCFATQDKVWFQDPDGNDWEIFYVRQQLPVEGPLANEGCCAGQSSACGCE